jgi:transcriptional regulator with XRE-family HTH domain
MLDPLSRFEGRRIFRCVPCNLVQFQTANGECRRCRSAILKRMQDGSQTVFLPHQEPLAAVKRIGQQVRVLREGRGLTRKDFSVRLSPHVSRSYACRIESGCVKPSLQILERIAVILDVPLGAFFLDPQSLETLVYSQFAHEIVPLLKRIPDRTFNTIVSFVRRISGDALSNMPGS